MPVKKTQTQSNVKKMRGVPQEFTVESKTIKATKEELQQFEKDLLARRTAKSQ